MSIEALQQMDGPTARRILNEINNPPKQEHPTDLGNGFHYTRENEYQGNLLVYKYTIYDTDVYQCCFYIMQYPACCGITIIHNFNARNDLSDGLEEALTKFFKRVSTQLRPNIQFVAVKYAEREEEYDEDDDEYYDKIIGLNEHYDYQKFIDVLCNVLKPTLISSFINKNSDNQCDIYQATNPNW